jgi:hypothetical protein
MMKYKYNKLQNSRLRDILQGLNYKIHLDAGLRCYYVVFRRFMYAILGDQGMDICVCVYSVFVFSCV